MAKKRVLMLVGGEYHPFEACAAIFKEFVEASGRYTVTVTADLDTLKADAVAKFDAVVLTMHAADIKKPQLDGLLNFVEKGGALVALHTAAASFKKQDAYIDLIGGVFKGHGEIIEFPLTFTGADSMITRRIPSFRITDEIYLLDRFDASKCEVLATAYWQGETVPVIYTKSHGKGRVFVSLLGHDMRAYLHPGFEKTTLRGLDWALGREERKTLKAGVVGYGPSFNMGRGHMTWMRNAAGFDAVAACDIDPARCKAAEEENPGIETYPNLTAMLKKTDAELIVVITPHNTHAKLVQQILNSGRHAITEKPFCVTTKEADAMIDAARKNKRMLSVFHNRRWDGDYMTLRKIMESGAIGEVFHIEACFGGYGHPSYWWRSHKPIAGGAFYDGGAHFVDWILNMVPSKIAEVSGYFQFKKEWFDVTNEDHCEALIRFQNGVRASLEISALAAARKSRWRILGSKGSIEEIDYERCRVTHFGLGLRHESVVTYLPSDWEAYYRNVADHLLLGEPLAVTAESARRVIGVIETAEKSSRAGKAMPVPKGCE
ncbi:MAG: ThuA domain-containing protein [FCB group bacterium]|jgi:predicted dehydrogenase/type 1 glutamine amidotransferase|nr:ThuA domain-containing protein [FCB group bacterium]